MTAFPDHPYTCKFYYPYDATYDTATASVKIKAPERGDRRTKGRHQTFAKLKNGAVTVYDMGVTLSDLITLNFEQVPQIEWAQLLVFFEYVVWGANKIKYIDYKGDEYVVRIYKSNIEAINRGESKFDDNTTTLYDFSLELIDITNNASDTGQTAVPTQLALHLADYNHPHNPQQYMEVLSTDGTKVVESISTREAKHVTWIVFATDDTTWSKTWLIHGTHNGDYVVDATTVGSAQEVLVSVGTPASDITFSVALAGTGSAQTMDLRCAKVAGSCTLRLRRIKV